MRERERERERARAHVRYFNVSMCVCKYLDIRLACTSSIHAIDPSYDCTRNMLVLYSVLVLSILSMHFCVSVVRHQIFVAATMMIFVTIGFFVSAAVVVVVHSCIRFSYLLFSCNVHEQCVRHLSVQPCEAFAPHPHTSSHLGTEPIRMSLISIARLCVHSVRQRDSGRAVWIEVRTQLAMVLLELCVGQRRARHSHVVLAITA